MRCAIYARAAADDPACEMQLRELRAYVDRRGWAITGEYVDTGCSGANSTRPQLTKLMGDARAGHLECVLVWKFDRWGRSLVGCLDSIRALDDLGVRWLAVYEGLDTGVPSTTSLVGIIDVFRGWGAESKRERIKAGMRVAKRRDGQLGRPKRIFDREEVRRLSSEGKSSREIAKELRIGRGTVQRLLAGP